MCELRVKKKLVQWIVVHHENQHRYHHFEIYVIHSKGQKVEHHKRVWHRPVKLKHLTMVPIVHQLIMANWVSTHYFEFPGKMVKRTSCWIWICHMSQMNPSGNLKSWLFNTTTQLVSAHKSQRTKLISWIKPSYFKNWWISQILFRFFFISDVNNKHCYVDICAVRVTAWQSKTSIVDFITRCHFKSMYYDIGCHFIFHIVVSAGALVLFLFFFSRLKHKHRHTYTRSDITYGAHCNGRVTRLLEHTKHKRLGKKSIFKKSNAERKLTTYDTHEKYRRK